MTSPHRAAPPRRRESHGGRQAADHHGERRLVPDAEQPVQGLLELLLVHLAPGVEPLQDVDAALPEGLGDRGPWLIGNHLGGHVRHTTEPPAARPTVVQTRPAARGGVRSGPFVPWADH